MTTRDEHVFFVVDRKPTAGGKVVVASGKTRLYGEVLSERLDGKTLARVSLVKLLSWELKNKGP